MSNEHVGTSLSLQTFQMVVEFIFISLKGKLKPQRKTGRVESSRQPPHHLTKQYLRSWMEEMEASQQEIKDEVQQLQVRIFLISFPPSLFSLV